MPFTVTATQQGSTQPGMLMSVKVLTGAAQTQNGQTAEVSGASLSPPQLAITPNANNSRIFGALVTAGAASSSSFTPNAATTFFQNTVQATIQYGTVESSSATTAGTPVTIGATAPTGNTSGGIALAEILAAGTIAIDASTPADTAWVNATSITSAAFSPPPGSLLLAMVSSLSNVVATIAITDTSGLGLTWTLLVRGNVSGNGVVDVWIAAMPAAAIPPQPRRLRAYPVATRVRVGRALGPTTTPAAAPPLGWLPQHSRPVRLPARPRRAAAQFPAPPPPAPPASPPRHPAAIRPQRRVTGQAPPAVVAAAPPPAVPVAGRYRRPPVLWRRTRPAVPPGPGFTPAAAPPAPQARRRIPLPVIRRISVQAPFAPAAASAPPPWPPSPAPPRQRRYTPRRIITGQPSPAPLAAPSPAPPRSRRFVVRRVVTGQAWQPPPPPPPVRPTLPPVRIRRSWVLLRRWTRFPGQPPPPPPALQKATGSSTVIDPHEGLASVSEVDAGVASITDPREGRSSVS